MPREEILLVHQTQKPTGGHCAYKRAVRTGGDGNTGGTWVAQWLAKVFGQNADEFPHVSTRPTEEARPLPFQDADYGGPTKPLS